jgi:hypothetical protein
VGLGTLPLILLIVVIGLFVVSLRRRRHGESDAPAAGWSSTSEVFKDPTTGRLMRVWVDSAGERHYVPEK